MIGIVMNTFPQNFGFSQHRKQQMAKFRSDRPVVREGRRVAVFAVCSRVYPVDRWAGIGVPSRNIRNMLPCRPTVTLALRMPAPRPAPLQSSTAVNVRTEVKHGAVFRC